MFVIVGLLNLVKPTLVLNLKVFMANHIYGAELKPSDKTLKIQRVLGIIFLILGVLALTGKI